MMSKAAAEIGDKMMARLMDDADVLIYGQSIDFSSISVHHWQFFGWF